MTTDDAFKILDAKLGKLTDSVIEIKVGQGVVQADLREHMRRSAAAEANIALLRLEVEPLKAHVSAFVGAGKLIAVLGAGVGIVVGLMRVFGV